MENAMSVEHHTRRTCFKGLAGTVAACLVLGASSPGYALSFNITSTGNANVDAGFQQAATLWESIFADDVTVNITAAFSPLGAGILGSASSTQTMQSFNGVKNALDTDATSDDDDTAVANLPGGPALDIYINRTLENPNGPGSATPYVDNNGGANNTTIRISSGNAKALGLIGGHLPGQDAAITFNSTFAFDFDPSDGITGGQYDFVGVAAHELGHAMGFISGVDILDINSGLSENAYTWVSVLDLYRHSGDSQNAGADIDWTADNRSKYFSIDGGITNLTPDPNGGFSTGKTFGDGRQASHWKDNLGLGIMDPTFMPGELGVISSLDIQGFDVIGWDQVSEIPEPSTLLLLGTGLLGIIFFKRRKS